MYAAAAFVFSVASLVDPAGLGARLAADDAVDADTALAKLEHAGDGRAALVAYAAASMRDGRDRNAVVALQRLIARWPADDDAALWQLAVVVNAASFGERAQVEGQLARFAGLLHALHARSDERFRILAALAEPFLTSWTTESYAVGPGCFGAGLWDAPTSDLAPRLLAESSTDATTRAYAYFVIGEMHVYAAGERADPDDDLRVARAAYDAAVAVPRGALWAGQAYACLARDLRGCGRSGHGIDPAQSARAPIADALVAR